MEINSIIIDYLATLKWVLLAIVIFLFFKRPISNLLKRIRKYNPKTQELEFYRLEKQSDIKEKSKEAEKEIEDLKIYKEKAIEYEKKIKLWKKDKIVKELKNKIALKDIIINFEKIYNTIFGSQIKLLVFLLQSAPKGIDISVINSTYQNVQNKNYILKKWTINDYLRFLFTEDLIDVSQGKYIITNKGEVFLNYIKHSGYTLEKML